MLGISLHEHIPSKGISEQSEEHDYRLVKAKVAPGHIHHKAHWEQVDLCSSQIVSEWLEMTT